VTNQKLLISTPQSITNYSPQSRPLFHPAVRARDVVRRRIALYVAAHVAVTPARTQWTVAGVPIAVEKIIQPLQLAQIGLDRYSGICSNLRPRRRRR